MQIIEPGEDRPTAEIPWGGFVLFGKNRGVVLLDMTFLQID